MKLFPAIDIFEGKVVRLFRGNYSQMTVYGDNPLKIAKGFFDCGAENLHVVDLEGAKTGKTPNIDIISRLASESGLFIEVGGGIRIEETIKAYKQAGTGRVILGTAAVSNPEFTDEMIGRYGEFIAVGVDIKDGLVATHGWTEASGERYLDFCRGLEKRGVKTVICTDISKDGVLAGTNLDLYRELASETGLNIIASGGVSSVDDIKKLREIGVYGAILGKALYAGKLDLKEAISAAI